MCTASNDGQDGRNEVEVVQLLPLHQQSSDRHNQHYGIGRQSGLDAMKRKLKSSPIRTSARLIYRKTQSIRDEATYDDKVIHDQIECGLIAKVWFRVRYT
jgi:hypothetical protein